MEDQNISKEKRFPDNFKEIIIARLREKDEIIQAIKEGRIQDMIDQGKISGNWS